MHQGHRGANHPVKRLADGRVEITSMNHGFAVETESLPANARETHVSLFDGSNCGLELTDRPAFSVQYHPEASPGPQDSTYLFGKFVRACSREPSCGASRSWRLVSLAGCSARWLPSRRPRRLQLIQACLGHIGPQVGELGEADAAPYTPSSCRARRRGNCGR